MKRRLKIFALGGNEVAPTDIIDPKTGKTINPDIPAQWKRAARACELLADIIEAAPDDDYVVTHGNGPQVGNILLRSDYSLPILPPIPLDVIVADTQGAMGYMLLHIGNALRAKGIRRPVAAIVTQVVVDPLDPDFKDPSKFIGPGYSPNQIEEKEGSPERYKRYHKNGGREIWRRVVGSPKPVDIVEIDTIEANLRAGVIPIAVGGGGIPVHPVQPQKTPAGEVFPCRHSIVFEKRCGSGNPVPDIYSGVDAVIDKDLATSLMGALLMERAAQRGEHLTAELTILTNVDGVKRNFGKPDQADLRQLNAAEAQQLYDQGLFPSGSMGPKVLAAIEFVCRGGQRAFITEVSAYEDTVAGRAGTTILP